MTIKTSDKTSDGFLKTIPQSYINNLMCEASFDDDYISNMVFDDIVAPLDEDEKLSLEAAEAKGLIKKINATDYAVLNRIEFDKHIKGD